MEEVNRVPKHIGLVLDGNRRFAKKLMLKPWMGHEWGAKKIRELFEWCSELGVKEVTLYTFSVQNFNRPKDEFDYLMNLFVKEFNDIAKDENIAKVHEKGLRINFIGRIWMFPSEVQKAMLNLMDLTKQNNGFIVNFAMAYGGREEVIDAVKKVAEQIKAGELDINKINEETFARNLYLNSDPEIIIRTGGDHRTSNFLVWQSNYSEWFFLEKTWPEFEKQDLIACIDEFGRRERRFGR